MRPCQASDVVETSLVIVVIVRETQGILVGIGPRQEIGCGSLGEQVFREIRDAPRMALPSYLSW